MTLFVVAQPVTPDSRRFRGGLPAGHNGGAVERLQLKNRSRGHYWGETASMDSVHEHV